MVISRYSNALVFDHQYRVSDCIISESICLKFSQCQTFYAQFQVWTNFSWQDKTWAKSLILGMAEYIPGTCVALTDSLLAADFSIFEENMVALKKSF
jgi:hypothetical protein